MALLGLAYATAIVPRPHSDFLSGVLEACLASQAHAASGRTRTVTPAASLNFGIH